MEDKEVVEALMTRDDVVEFIKSVTKGMTLSTSNSSFSSSSVTSVTSVTSSSSSSSSPVTSWRSQLAGVEGVLPDGTTAAELQRDVDESNEDDDEALEVVDKIMEMELAEEQYSTETTTDETELLTVEGEFLNFYFCLNKIYIFSFQSYI